MVLVVVVDILICKDLIGGIYYILELGKVKIEVMLLDFNFFLVKKKFVGLLNFIKYLLVFYLCKRLCWVFGGKVVILKV